MTDSRIGTLLHPSDRSHVLSSFIYRMTHESVKRWPEATMQMRDGGFRMSLISDEEWLASTRFAIRRDGRLDERSKRCEHDHSKFRDLLRAPE